MTHFDGITQFSLCGELSLDEEFKKHNLYRSFQLTLQSIKKIPFF